MKPSDHLRTLLILCAVLVGDDVAGASGPQPVRNPLVDVPWTALGGAPVFAPGGRVAARAADRTGRELLIVDVATGGVLASRILPSHPQAMAFTPDGGTLYMVGADHRASAWAWTTDRWIAADAPPPDAQGYQPLAVLLSPDRSRLLVASAVPYSRARGRWAILDTGDLREIAHGPLRDVVDQTLAWLPDGRAWLAAQGSSKIERRDAEGAMMAPWVAPFPAGRLSSSPDGRHIGVAGGGASLAVLDGEAAVLRQVRGEPAEFGLAWDALVWAPDGGDLAGLWTWRSGQDGTVVVLGRDGAVTRTEANVDGESLAWDAAGRRLLVRNSIGGATTIVEPTNGGVLQLPLPANDRVEVLPYGDQLLTAAGPRPWPGVGEALPEEDGEGWSWNRSPEGEIGFHGEGARWWPFDLASATFAPPWPAPSSRAAESVPRGFEIRWPGGGLRAGTVLPYEPEDGLGCQVKAKWDSPGYGAIGPRGAWARLFCTAADMTYRELVVAWRDVRRPPTATRRITGADRITTTGDGAHLFVAWNDDSHPTLGLSLPDLVAVVEVKAPHVAPPGALLGGDAVLGTGGAELTVCPPGGAARCLLAAADARAACMASLTPSCEVHHLARGTTEQLPGYALSGTSPDGRWVIVRDPTQGMCAFDRVARRCLSIPDVDPQSHGLWAFLPSGRGVLRQTSWNLGNENLVSLIGHPIGADGIGPGVPLGDRSGFGTMEILPGILAEEQGRWLRLVRLHDGAELQMTVTPGDPPGLVVLRGGEMVATSGAPDVWWRDADDPPGTRRAWGEVPDLAVLQSFLALNARGAPPR